MEVVGTGHATYKDNNVSLDVNYGVKTANFTETWTSADADILGEIEAAIAERASRGYTTERAITSSKVISYMLKNNAIKSYWANKAEPLTQSRLISWIRDNYGVELVVNDATYKTALSDTTAKRFYPENAITFLSTRTAVGQGMFGYTPEELALPETSEKNFVTVTQWYTEDPVAVWTKASALYVPVLKDSNSISIYTVKTA
jgi:heme-degrading monooxygenase HmoA